MTRNYGTPLPPGMRRPLFRSPRLPRDRSAWIAAARRRGTWLRVGLVTAVLFIIGSAIGTALSTPERPRYDVAGENRVLGPISFTAPAGWVLFAESQTLQRPAFLFAPQADAKKPPITISIVALDVTSRLKKVLDSYQGEPISDFDLLKALVISWCNDLKISPPNMSLGTYNLGPTSGVAAVSLIAEWSQPLPWRPRLSTTGAANATPTPTPSLSPSPESGQDAGLPPLDYPVLGEPQPGLFVRQVQAFYLPPSASFSGRDENGEPFRRMLVVTLTYPADLDQEAVTEVRTSFDRLTTSLFFSS